jgi:hypothetical protein
MNSIQKLVVDLVAIGESPLCSTARWVNQQLGHEVALRPFLGLIDELLQEDIPHPPECVDAPGGSVVPVGSHVLTRTGRG